MSIQIPNWFRLLGHVITVVPDPELSHQDDCIGEWRVRKMAIRLLPTSLSTPQARSVLEHTYLHELTHAILHMMGKNELNKDEEFVDVFAGLLHQALTTGEGNCPLTA